MSKPHHLIITWLDNHVETYEFASLTENDLARPALFKEMQESGFINLMDDDGKMTVIPTANIRKVEITNLNEWKARPKTLIPARRV